MDQVQHQWDQRHEAFLRALTDHAQQPDRPQLGASVALLHVVREGIRTTREPALIKAFIAELAVELTLNR
ncbi:hypothetical protein WI92_22520 [Burkholderia vietnamiensis]|nr:hypothetical protein WI92_22520 [Burkholderia vietnamiensis]